jgi:hypothetical protein
VPGLRYAGHHDDAEPPSTGLARKSNQGAVLRDQRGLRKRIVQFADAPSGLGAIINSIDDDLRKQLTAPRRDMPDEMMQVFKAMVAVKRTNTMPQISRRARRASGRKVS